MDGEVVGVQFQVNGSYREMVDADVGVRDFDWCSNIV